MPTKTVFAGLGSDSLTLATSKVGFAGGCCAKPMPHQTRRRIVGLIIENAITCLDTHGRTLDTKYRAV